jgi:hypothetical protein
VGPGGDWWIMMGWDGGDVVCRAELGYKPNSLYLLGVKNTCGLSFSGENREWCGERRGVCGEKERKSGEKCKYAGGKKYIIGLI